MKEINAELLHALENLVENIQDDKDWWPDGLRKAVRQAEAVIEKAETKTIKIKS